MKVARRMDFFIVGAQKSATTALSVKLNRCPGICCSEPKELHLFDNESLNWSARAVPDVTRHFCGCAADCLWGEATPIYMYWPNAVERLAAYNPAAKIIVILRHPAYRALSHWKMETSRRAETLSFAEAISEVGRARVGAAHRVFSYVERGFYASQIERILAFFPRGNVFFCKMEDLYQDEVSVLGDIQRFLDVPVGPVDTGAKYVVSINGSRISTDASIEIESLSALYRADILQTAQLTGLDLEPWVNADYSEGFLTDRPTTSAESTKA